MLTPDAGYLGGRIAILLIFILEFSFFVFGGGAWNLVKWAYAFPSILNSKEIILAFRQTGAIFRSIYQFLIKGMFEIPYDLLPAGRQDVLDMFPSVGKALS
ncbi:hypothetical protein AXF13_08155 [Desulfovibrio fairfieldensis]|uniref:Uncharacterized protein n=1 Tax=Desulfovibrio fairfieldensis TaxID=44742 RepID=A0A109W4C2_9BACT|nr:hypothetical protein AXF13_08155 [Desulfovibrio fairfieldensis]